MLFTQSNNSPSIRVDSLMEVAHADHVRIISRRMTNEDINVGDKSIETGFIRWTKSLVIWEPPELSPISHAYSTCKRSPLCFC